MVRLIYIMRNNSFLHQYSQIDAFNAFLKPENISIEIKIVSMRAFYSKYGLICFFKAAILKSKMATTIISDHVCTGGCFTLIVLMPTVSLPHNAVAWSAVCD